MNITYRIMDVKIEPTVDGKFLLQTRLQRYIDDGTSQRLDDEKFIHMRTESDSKMVAKAKEVMQSNATQELFNWIQEKGW